MWKNMEFIQQSEPVMVKIDVTLKPCTVPAINCVCVRTCVCLHMLCTEDQRGCLICNVRTFMAGLCNFRRLFEYLG